MDEQQIKHELTRVLASESFRSRKQMCNFLQFIVDETLEGRGRYLKQYTIAVHGLGKQEDFSPGENPLVRVEAGRLRKLLVDYYNTDGRNSSVRITLPKGSYQPEFQENVVDGKGFVERRREDRRAANVTRAYSEGMRVLLGFKLFSPSQQNSELYYLLVRDFTLLLNKFPFIKFLSASPNNTSNLSAHEYLKHIWDNYQADFLLKMDVEVLANRLSLKSLLLHAVTEEVVWGDTFDIHDAKSSKDMERVYQRLANDLFAIDSGVALRYWSQYIQSEASRSKEHNHALLYLSNSFMGYSARELQVALDYCNHRLAEHPHDTIAMQVYLYLSIQDMLYGYQILDRASERFVEVARTLIRLSPDSAESRLFFAFASFLQNDDQLCRSEIDKALVLNKYSAFNHFFASGLYYVLGDYPEADSAIDQAISMSHRHPDWYHLLCFIRDYRRQDYAAALEQARSIYIAWGGLLRALAYRKLEAEADVSREMRQINGQDFRVLDDDNELMTDIIEDNEFLHAMLRDMRSLLAGIRHQH
ncbi:MAG: hypothetical protein KDI44_09035 [Thiothrix sp.]|nr:hypothetical protein [Thiothrix sp.]HPQ95087.1 hypothetical protein [Thiolinea sp.]